MHNPDKNLVVPCAHCSMLMRHDSPYDHGILSLSKSRNRSEDISVPCIIHIGIHVVQRFSSPAADNINISRAMKMQLLPT